MRRIMKKALLVIVALVAFESFGFGFLLDGAKLAVGVTVKAVQNIRNYGVSHEPCVYTFRTK